VCDPIAITDGDGALVRIGPSQNHILGLASCSRRKDDYAGSTGVLWWVGR
jgi:hypothetical protein